MLFDMSVYTVFRSAEGLRGRGGDGGCAYHVLGRRAGEVLVTIEQLVQPVQVARVAGVGLRAHVVQAVRRAGGVGGRAGCSTDVAGVHEKGNGHHREQRR